MKRPPRPHSHVSTLRSAGALRRCGALLALVLSETAAPAFVYVSDIWKNRVDLSEQQVVLSRPGRRVSVSYILNEPASGGLLFEIISTNQEAIWNLSLPAVRTYFEEEEEQPQALQHSSTPELHFS